MSGERPKTKGTKNFALDLSKLNSKNADMINTERLIKYGTKQQQGQLKSPRNNPYNADYGIAAANPGSPLRQQSLTPKNKTLAPHIHINVKPESLASYSLFQKRMYPKTARREEIQKALDIQNKYDFLRKNSQNTHTLLSPKSYTITTRKTSHNNIFQSVSQPERNFSASVQGKLVGPTTEPKAIQSSRIMSTVNPFELDKVSFRGSTATVRKQGISISHRGALPQVGVRSQNTSPRPWGMENTMGGDNKYELKIDGISPGSRKDNVIETKNNFVRVLRQERSKELQKNLSDCFKPIVDNTNTKFLLNIDLLYKNDKIFKLK